MRRALLVLLLAAACSSGGQTASPTPSASETPVDPFSAIAPPRSPGIGDTEAIVTNRAYSRAQGLLAEALLERGTLVGADPTQLATDLAGESEDTSVAAALTGSTAAGLDFRPLFAASVTVPQTGFVEVVRSTWGGSQVAGLGGERVLKITWDGAVRYRVTYGGAPVDVDYALSTSWIFSPSTEIAGELSHVTTLRGKATVTPQPPACTAKGVLVPVPEPYPATCPLTK